MPTTTTLAPSSSGGTSLIAQHDALIAAVIALGFGLLAISALLWFLLRDRRRSFETINRLAAAGNNVAVRSESALAGDDTKSLLTRTAISGPNVLSVGMTGPYSLSPAPAAGATVTWSISSGPGTLSSTTGPETQLTVTAVGNIVLDAAISGGGAASPPQPLTISGVSGTAPKTDQVSMLGSGYGTVVIALAVASVTATLGLTDVINGQAVAGILGSLVTYSVIRGATAAAAGGTTAAGGGTAAAGKGSTPSAGSD